MRISSCPPGRLDGRLVVAIRAGAAAAAGHDARALPFRGVGERAAELSPELDNDVFLADTIDYLEARTCATSCWSATVSAA